MYLLFTMRDVYRDTFFIHVHLNFYLFLKRLGKRFLKEDGNERTRQWIYVIFFEVYFYTKKYKYQNEKWYSNDEKQVFLQLLQIVCVLSISTRFYREHFYREDISAKPPSKNNFSNNKNPSYGNCVHMYTNKSMFTNLLIIYKNR